MFEITNRTSAPYSSVCYIYCEWAVGSATRGSGVVVGRNDVLTANHVVYDATRGGYATSITIVPAADTSPFVQPYGSWIDVGLISSRTPNWDTNNDQLVSASEAQYDMALLGLRSAIGDITGWLATSATGSDFSGMMLGYPGRGTGMMAENVAADASSSWGVFDIGSGLGPGASGGPLLLSTASGTSVVGVLSSGNYANTHSTYAGLFGPGNAGWLAGAMAANDSLLGGAPPAADDYAGSASTLGELMLGAAAKGTLETTTDSDWFKITLQAGSYRFEARGQDSGDGTLGDPLLQLYSAGGALLAQDDDSGTGLNASLAYTITTAGTYYVAVAAPAGPVSTSGTYTVLASLASGGASYVGTAGDDRLGGTAADESFTGGPGNDVLTGGGGTDTARYAGARADYRLFNAGSTITVTDKQSARDGIDSLSQIERVAFSDMTVNLGIGANARTISAGQLKLLQELYVAFFNRVPDADGLSYWIDQARGGQQVQSIAESFYSAALLYPSLTGYSAAMGSGDFVNLVYRNVLGRSEGADAEGLAYWRGALDSGAQSRGQLVTTILASAHSFKGRSDFGWVADLLDNKAAVAQAFAVDMGLNYNTAEQSIQQGMAIAAAVTPTSTAAAISLIGVSDGFSTA